MKITFCRFETRSWEKKDTNCLTGFPALKSQASHQVLGIVSTRFTVDDVSLGGTKARIFTEFTKYKNQALPNNDGDRLRYYESRFWLGEKGLILRQEIRSGFVVEKDISSMWIDIYDYNPKDLKIEAPIN